MSSNTYFAELQPDATLRSLVVLSGSGLCLTAIMLFLLLPLPAAAKALGSAAWLFFSYREISTLARGYGDCRRLRIGVGGDLAYLDHNRQWCEARLLPGSAVLPRVAWILFTTQGGHRAAELLCGNCRKSHDWRRLQVIWRHIGAAE